jgi:hypothetical protein
MVLKMQQISIFLKKYVSVLHLSLSDSKIKTVVDLQKVSENVNGETVSNLKLYEKKT